MGYNKIMAYMGNKKIWKMTGIKDNVLDYISSRQ